jgi:hypothetical protein
MQPQLDTNIKKIKRQWKLNTKETKKESYIWIHDAEENGSTQY